MSGDSSPASEPTPDSVDEVPTVDPITEPGVHYDLHEAAYHADPVEGGSLSQSGAKLLLPPNVPAMFDHVRRNPPAYKRVWDEGTAAHTLVLGTGQPIREVVAKDWRTNAAKAAAKEAREAGEVPLLPAQVAMVRGMEAALRAHPSAVDLLNPEHTRTEVSMFARDPWAGVWLRGRLDTLNTDPTAGRVRIVDYKTASDLDDHALEGAIARFGYVMQAPWYLDLVVELGIVDSLADVEFVFLFQSKAPPYLVRTVRLDAGSVRIGRQLNQQAIAIYAECRKRDTWPGYSDRVDTLAVPGWFVREHRQDLDPWD